MSAAAQILNDYIRLASKIRPEPIVLNAEAEGTKFTSIELQVAAQMMSASHGWRQFLATLQLLCPVKNMEISIQDWLEQTTKTLLQRTDMNQLIMNYLVMEGFKEAAEKFAFEANIQPPMDLEQLDERIKIRTAIQNGSIKEAMRMVTTIHPEILDDNSKLFFHLQQLVLIELIRNGKIEEAVNYAQDHLAERGQRDPAVLHQLERTLALLAFDPPDSSPFADLLHPSHRQKVASELNAAILKAQNQEETTPMLVELLKLLLWAQDQLSKKKIKFPVMTELTKATIQAPPKKSNGEGL